MTVIRFSPDAERREHTPVDNRFLTEYMPHASGLQVQVYLYGLMQCRYPSMCEHPLAEALGLSEEAVAEAFCYWQSEGLVRIASDHPLTVEYRDIGSGAASDALPGKYAALVRKINGLTAPRQFGISELKHVYDWIEVYALEEGAVLELIAHCMELRGRRVSIQYMSRVAESWAERGIKTFQDAHRSIEDYDIKRHGASAVLRAWNKRRKPTEDEMALYDKWVREWGFTDEAILAALPRLTVTGSPNFTYLDELLNALRGSELTDRTRIEADASEDAALADFARLLFQRAGKAEPATRTQRAQIGMYLNTFGMPRELLLYAADCCKGANEPFGRMKHLLNAWHDKGIMTVRDAEQAQKSPAPTPVRRSAPYAQHDIDADMLDRILHLNEDL